MNRNPMCVGVLLCAALLSACSGPPKLKEPSGPWVEANPSSFHSKQEICDVPSKK